MFGIDIDKIPGFGKLIGIVERTIIVLEKLAENTDIKEQFKSTGKLNAGFTVYDYDIKFTIEDKRKTAITAEITETEAQE